MSDRRCNRCGSPLAPAATFCRSCGARYEPPPPAPAAGHEPPRNPARGAPSRSLIFAAVAIVLAGAGAAIAIIVGAGGGGSSTTTVVAGGAGGGAVEQGEAGAASAAGGSGRAAPEAVYPGLYVQAGSFKFAEDAEAEQQRLAGLGIEVEVLASELAQELYPGFEVLLVGPLRGGAEAKAVVRRLRHNGVPSAFPRPLTPAEEIAGPDAAAGRWTGSLTESSTEHPRLNRSLEATLTVSADGSGGVLDVPELHCQVNLTTVAAPGPSSLAFAQSSSGCLGPGTWNLRPVGGEMTMTLLPRGIDTIILGSLQQT